MGGRKPTMPFSILLLIHEDVGEQLEPLWTARDGGPLACEAEWATESSPLAFLEGLIKEIRAQSAQCREHLKDINIFLGCYECRRDGMPLMIGPIPAISPWSLRFDLVCLRGAGTRGDHDWETRYGKAPTRGLRHWVPLRANVLNTEQSGTTLSVIASDESGAHDVGQLTHRSLLLVEQTEKKKNKEGRGKKAPEEAYDTLVLGGKPIHGPDQRVAQTIYMEEYLSDIAAQVTATSSTASTSLTTTDEEGSEQGRYSANYTVQDGAVITTGAVIQTIEQYCRKGGLLMLDWGTLYLRDIDQQCLPLVPWYPYLELPFIQPLMMSSQLQDDHVDGFCRTIIPSGVLLSTKGGK